MLKHCCLILFLLGLCGCATSPTGRSQLLLVNEGQMASAGEQTFEQIKNKNPPLPDPKANAKVICIVGALTQVLPVGMREDWEIQVFDNTTPNAFALPGKKIGVNLGMLRLVQDNDQLAAVIGHEIGHVLAQHGNERASIDMLEQAGEQLVGQFAHPAIASALGMGAQMGIFLPYSRIQEAEADILGQDIMARAGFNPLASVKLWELLQKQSGSRPEFLSTHPSSAKRIQQLEAHMSQADLLYKQAIWDGKKPSCR